MNYLKWLFVPLPSVALVAGCVAWGVSVFNPSFPVCSENATSNSRHPCAYASDAHDETFGSMLRNFGLPPLPADAQQVRFGFYGDRDTDILRLHYTATRPAIGTFLAALHAKSQGTLRGADIDSKTGASEEPETYWGNIYIEDWTPAPDTTYTQYGWDEGSHQGTIWIGEGATPVVLISADFDYY